MLVYKILDDLIVASQKKNSGIVLGLCEVHVPFPLI